MPIYECNCQACGITFEILAPVSEANRKRPCPRCARLARRVVSAFAIGNASAPHENAAANASATSPAHPGHSHSGHAHHGNPLRGRPRRPTVPDFARLCWMDDRSAERFAAYKVGQGAEYDDKSAARDELRKKRGLPPVSAPDQGHSPVAAMVARKKAEQAKKAAKSLKVAAPGAAPQ
jgi:putative FmdB family regulatory protein